MRYHLAPSALSWTTNCLILSDDIELDDHSGNVVWYRSLFVYLPYAIRDPVEELARENGTKRALFSRFSELTWSGKYIDLTRTETGSLLVELTDDGWKWLDEDEFEYPQFDELLEDHLEKAWEYDTTGEGNAFTHTLRNHWDGSFTYCGFPQYLLDENGHIEFAHTPARDARPRAHHACLAR